jgi:hypothetical protein
MASHPEMNRRKASIHTTKNLCYRGKKNVKASPFKIGQYMMEAILAILLVIAVAFSGYFAIYFQAVS